MSKTPSWMSSAEENKNGNTVGLSNIAKPRSKPGPKKAKIERKNVGFKISNSRNSDIGKLEALLKLEDLPLTRGRSETIELAVSILLELLIDSKNKVRVIELLKNKIGEEDNLDI